MRGIAAGARATGREPAGPPEEGRDKDRERGILQFLETGEQREYMLENRRENRRNRQAPAYDDARWDSGTCEGLLAFDEVEQALLCARRSRRGDQGTALADLFSSACPLARGDRPPP